MMTFLGGIYDRYHDVIRQDAVWNYPGWDPDVSPRNGISVSWNEYNNMPLTYSVVDRARSLELGTDTPRKKNKKPREISSEDWVNIEIPLLLAITHSLTHPRNIVASSPIMKEAVAIKTL